MLEKKMEVLNKYRELLEIKLTELKVDMQTLLQNGGNSEDIKTTYYRISEIEFFLEKYNREIKLFASAEENVRELLKNVDVEQYTMIEKLEHDAQNILYGGYVSNMSTDSSWMSCISRLKGLIKLLDELLECEKIRINNLTIGEIVIAIDVIEKSIDKLIEEPSIIKLFEVRKDIILVARKLTIALKNVKWNKDLDEYDNIIDSLWSAEDKLWLTIQMLGPAELNCDMTELLYGTNGAAEVLTKYLSLFGYAKEDVLDELLSFVVNKPFIDIELNNTEVFYNSKTLDRVHESVELSLKRVR